MRRIVTTPRFERRLGSFLAKHGELEPNVQKVMTRIAGSKTAGLRVHALKGPLQGCHAARVSYEYRIIFILSKEEVCFIDIGTHDDVYR